MVAVGTEEQVRVSPGAINHVNHAICPSLAYIDAISPASRRAQPSCMVNTQKYHPEYPAAHGQRGAVPRWLLLGAAAALLLAVVTDLVPCGDWYVLNALRLYP